jgi:hypothetical protein
MKRFLLALSVAAVALAASESALATPPTPVTIHVQSIFANSFGTFTTSGAGLCASGTTTDDSLGKLFATGYQSGTHVNFHDLKTFTCDDGSGTFAALLQVRYVFDAPATTFSWVIMSGTGDYTKLHGTGNGIGSQLPGEVDDTFTGAVHFD